MLVRSASLAQRGGAETADTECEPEEEPRNQTHTSRHQFLRVDEDGREGRRQDHADDHAQHACPEQVDVRQRQAERQHAEDRSPDDVFPADPVADRTADERAGGHGREKHEQVQLRALHRDVEAVDQEEGVVAGQAREVDVLGENQREQYRQSEPDLTDGTACRWLALRRACDVVPAVRLNHAPTFHSSTMPVSAATANHAMLDWPRGSTMNAASSGPSAEPMLPPV